MRKRTNWRDATCEDLTAEEVAVRLYDSAKNKSRQRGLEFNLKFSDVLRQVNKGRCAVTGIPFDMRAKPYRGVDLPFRASLDRIDNTIGYLPKNVRVVVKIYNHAKWVWNDDDLTRLATAIVENIGEDDQ